MIALGLDLSLTATGVCILKDEEIVLLKTIKSKPDTKKTPLAEMNRIKKIVNSIEEIITNEEYKDISIVAIENFAFMAHNTTSLTQLAGLNYMVRNLLTENNKKWIIVAPSTLKKFITGKGNSSKDIMMLETFKLYGVSILDNNECDSFGLAKIGMASVQKTKLTESQREVIKLINKQI